MRDLQEVLAAFEQATQCVALIMVVDANGRLDSIAAADMPVALRQSATKALHDPRHSQGIRNQESPLGRHTVVVPVPGPGRAWLAVACAAPGATPHNYVKFLLPVVAQYLQSALEVEHAANELAERYEEINLLYTISEILGRTVNLDETARTILKEVSETVGARRGSILVHDRVTDTLQVIAMLPSSTSVASPIAIADEKSASAGVFRTQRARIVEPEEKVSDAETPYRRGAMLSVPIMWTGPNGAELLGVVNLSDRRSGQPFSAGDQKLIAAIATQIATAIQNARLVRSSLAQQRLVQEMQLAHDLQMKLLPSVAGMAPEAKVAARVVPAESVGGDFYNLFKLGDGKSGALVGDVSSHGYRAALIMALTMSASAIHAQGTSDPAELVNRLQLSLLEELATTEMFITLCYAVVNPKKGTLEYANTGHPHAFVVSGAGKAERLPALNPPLGMVDGETKKASRPWRAGEDLLLLFTDGISDARNARDERLGEEAVVDIVTRHRREDPEAIVDQVFEALARHLGTGSARDDLTIVVLRT